MICRGCDFILDTGFLGGDILDEEHQLRPGQGGVDPAVFNLADAVILGNIGDDSSSFETSDSGFHLRNDMQPARIYVSGRSQAVMSPDAVIGRIDSKEKVRLTPFEKHVLRFIDGRRPVETIRRQAGLDEAEVKTALANLADKGVVRVVGRALADAAEPEADTAPSLAKRAPGRRMRGTLVGAVVVVGDAADQAIDDAFRTQVRVDLPRLDPADMLADDDDVVFSASEDVLAAESLDFDNLESLEAPPPKNAVRPSAQKDAVNNLRDAKKKITAPRVAAADAEASDGFDDFDDPANVATAVVDLPSISGDSSVPANNNRPPSGVFADPRPPRSHLSEFEDFDGVGIDDLADSRVEPRPLPSPTARVLPPALASLPDASRPHLRLGGSLNDNEQAALTGGVWGDPRRTNSVGKAVSTSLSDLLGPSASEELPPGGHDSDDDTAFRAQPPQMAPVVVSRPPRHVDTRGSESAAERGRPAKELKPDVSFEVATNGQQPQATSDVATHELRLGNAREELRTPEAATARKVEPVPANGRKLETPTRPPPPPFLPGTNVKPREGALSSAPPPPLATVPIRPPPAPPDDLTAPPSQESESRGRSSAEVVDSALVIRPAGRAIPAKAAPKAPEPDDDDFMVDPDATMNLPPRPKSQENRSKSGANLTSDISVADASIARNRRPPTEDMRRKARNLFEQAQKDHAIGRIGAARMNAKLATIYDPDNEEFRHIVEAWDEKPKGTSSSMSRPEYVVLYEHAQDLEDEGDIDGALELLRKGIRMAPNAAAFHNRIGVILAMRKREFDRAAVEIEKAISLEPDNPHYRNNLGKIMQKASKRKDAAVAR